MSRGGKVVIKGFKPVKQIAGVKRNVYYMGRESEQLGQEKEQYFSRDHDLTTAKEFIGRVESHRALQHGSTVKAFKFVFSLREQDYTAYKRSGKDYKDIVRNVLADYENKHGVKLDWIAHVHQDGTAASHPHCHVTIKGVSDTLGDRGFKRIYFKFEDIKEMKNSFELEVEREAQYKWHERLDFSHAIGDMAKQFELATSALDQEAQKQLNEAEYQRHSKRKKKIRDKKQDRGR